MEWKIREDRPIYLQIIEYIQKQIVSGKLNSGDKLLSVRELSGVLKVSPNTVQKAYAELERMELVDTIRNTGREVTHDSAVIKKNKQYLAKNYINEFVANMKNMGFSIDEIIDSLKDMEGEV